MQHESPPKTHIAEDGTVRQDHYGSGRQPWDDIFDKGWAAPFAAGNVLKYLRRNKGDPAHDIESARWYWRRLYQLAANDSDAASYYVLHQLIDMLTPDEVDKVARLDE